MSSCVESGSGTAVVAAAAATAATIAPQQGPRSILPHLPAPAPSHVGHGSCTSPVPPSIHQHPHPPLPLMMPNPSGTGSPLQSSHNFPLRTPERFFHPRSASEKTPSALGTFGSPGCGFPTSDPSTETPSSRCPFDSPRAHPARSASEKARTPVGGFGSPRNHLPKSPSPRSRLTSSSPQSRLYNAEDKIVLLMSGSENGRLDGSSRCTLSPGAGGRGASSSSSPAAAAAAAAAAATAAEGAEAEAEAPAHLQAPRQPPHTSGLGLLISRNCLSPELSRPNVGVRPHTSKGISEYDAQLPRGGPGFKSVDDPLVARPSTSGAPGLVTPDWIGASVGQTEGRGGGPVEGRGTGEVWAIEVMHGCVRESQEALSVALLDAAVASATAAATAAPTAGPAPTAAAAAGGGGGGGRGGGPAGGQQEIRRETEGAALMTATAAAAPQMTLVHVMTRVPAGLGMGLPVAKASERAVKAHQLHVFKSSVVPILQFAAARKVKVHYLPVTNGHHDKGLEEAVESLRASRLYVHVKRPQAVDRLALTLPSGCVVVGVTKGFRVRQLTVPQVDTFDSRDGEGALGQQIEFYEDSGSSPKLRRPSLSLPRSEKPPFDSSSSTPRRIPVPRNKTYSGDGSLSDQTIPSPQATDPSPAHSVPSTHSQKFNRIPPSLSFEGDLTDRSDCSTPTPRFSPAIPLSPLLHRFGAAVAGHARSAAAVPGATSAGGSGAMPAAASGATSAALSGATSAAKPYSDHATSHQYPGRIGVASDAPSGSLDRYALLVAPDTSACASATPARSATQTTTPIEQVGYCHVQHEVAMASSLDWIPSEESGSTHRARTSTALPSAGVGEAIGFGSPELGKSRSQAGERKAGAMEGQGEEVCEGDEGKSEAKGSGSSRQMQRNRSMGEKLLQRAFRGGLRISVGGGDKSAAHSPLSSPLPSSSPLSARWVNAKVSEIAGRLFSRHNTRDRSDMNAVSVSEAGHLSHPAS